MSSMETALERAIGAAVEEAQSLEDLPGAIIANLKGTRPPGCVGWLIHEGRIQEVTGVVVRDGFAPAPVYVVYARGDDDDE